MSSSSNDGRYFSSSCVMKQRQKQQFTGTVHGHHNGFGLKTSNEDRHIEEASLLASRTAPEDLQNVLPAMPIDLLIERLPETITVLDALYTKFYAWQLQQKNKLQTTTTTTTTKTTTKPGTVTIDVLRPDHLLIHMVWLLSQEESEMLLPRFRRSLNLLGLTGHLKSILKVIQALAPHLRSQLDERKLKLEKALEGLGDHGLINFEENKLIELGEAIRIELSSNSKRSKSVRNKYDELLETNHSKRNHASTSANNNCSSKAVFDVRLKKGAAPSQSSHQRLMSFRLSEVKIRLNRNDISLQLLDELLNNVELTSLLRILRKRVNYDKEVLTEYTFLAKVARDHTFLGSDPVLAKLFVQFGKGYERLLSLMPVSSSADSGCGDEIELSDHSSGSLTPNRPMASTKSPLTLAMSTDLRLSSQTSGINSQIPGLFFGHQTPPNISCSFESLVPQRFSRISSDFPRISPAAARSQQNLLTAAAAFVEPLPLRTAISHSQLRQSMHGFFGDVFAHRNKERQLQHQDVRLSGSATSLSRSARLLHSSNKTTTPTTLSSREQRRWKSDKQKLKSERSKLASCTTIDPAGQIQLVNSASRNSSSRIGELVESYSKLYFQHCRQTQRELDTQKELRGCDELQMKILFSVEVLAFRSVLATLERCKSRLAEAIDDYSDSPPLDEAHNAVVTDLNRAFLAYIHHKMSQSNFAENTKGKLRYQPRLLPWN